MEWDEADRESMAIALYAAKHEITFCEASEQLLDADRRSRTDYLRMAQHALDHLGYLPSNRAPKLNVEFYHWLGDRAEAA